MENYIIPISISDYSIYDIFHNDNGEFVIITPGTTKELFVSPETPILNIKYENNVFECVTCKYNHTFVYKLKADYKDTIDLTINNNIVTTKVNKYPEFLDEILFSTEVKDEDDYIIQWIDFHKRLGVSRFIIYDNSDKNTLGTILNKHILDKIVVLIKWAYPLKSHNNDKRDGQATQQNHSIHTFQTSKYIGLFDIDEYLNIQRPLKLDEFIGNIIVENNINTDTISGFQLFNKFFYNPNNLPTDNTNFLQIYNCSDIIKEGSQKNIVMPKNLKIVCVHIIANGLPTYVIESKDGYFNHYQFLNKTHRGRDSTNNIDDSILKYIKYIF